MQVSLQNHGIMLGLGEERDEILQTMDDLRAVGCRVMTIGQYLQPTEKNIEVKEYIRPEMFEEYKTIGLAKGFRFVDSRTIGEVKLPCRKTCWRIIGCLHRKF